MSFLHAILHTLLWIILHTFLWILTESKNEYWNRPMPTFLYCPKIAFYLISESSVNGIKTSGSYLIVFAFFVFLKVGLKKNNISVLRV